ncbi:hypothetical protein [Henriciella sp.]|uniref:hypothetical protein n=1 Tax=Henriciella sp. TaxID=1968823 RepID=UPI002610EE67|nr:hypothetical protein [Henriciella sp.]
MTSEPDAYSVEWLREQLALMRGWRLTVSDSHKANAIARHETWLATQLADLTHRQIAA